MHSFRNWVGETYPHRTKVYSASGSGSNPWGAEQSYFAKDPQTKHHFCWKAQKFEHLSGVKGPQSWGWWAAAARLASLLGQVHLSIPVLLLLLFPGRPCRNLTIAHSNVADVPGVYDETVHVVFDLGFSTSAPDWVSRILEYDTTCQADGEWSKNISGEGKLMKSCASKDSSLRLLKLFSPNKNL